MLARKSHNAFAKLNTSIMQRIVNALGSSFFDIRDLVAMEL